MAVFAQFLFIVKDRIVIRIVVQVLTAFGMEVTGRGIIIRLLVREDIGQVCSGITAIVGWPGSRRAIKFLQFLSPAHELCSLVQRDPTAGTVGAYKIRQK